MYAFDAKSDQLHWWVVFFAPSAAEFAVPMLRNVFRLSAKDDSPGSALREAKIAAIGPTTASYLRNKLSLDVAVVSVKPDPVELAKVVFEHDQQSPRPPNSSSPYSR